MRGKYIRLAFCLAALFMADTADASFRGLAAHTADHVANGRMTRGDAAMALLQAIREPGTLTPLMAEKLNAPPEAGHRGDRCLTLDMLRIRAGLKNLDHARMKEAERLLGDDNPQGVFKTAALETSTSPVFAKTSSQLLTYQASTANFAFEWGTTLTDIDGTTPAKDENQNGLPDVIEIWASFFEYSLAMMKDLGYTDTPALDTYKIRVLIANSDPNTGVDYLPVGYYGVTNGVVPYVPGTPPAYILVANNFLSIVNANPNDLSQTSQTWGMWGAMAVTAAHELFHLVQFMYAPSQWETDATLDADSWWLEASSTWMEDEIFPFINDYKQYYQHGTGWEYYPYLTLAYEPDPTVYEPWGIARKYGSAIFAKYLSEHMGGPGIMTAAWTNLKADNTLKSSIELAAETTNGNLPGTWTFEDIYLGFSGANAVMDYDDGALYGSMLLSSMTNPEKFGSSFSSLPSAPSASMSLSLASQPSQGDLWGLSLTATKNDSSEKYSIILTGQATSITANVGLNNSLSAVASYLGPFANATYKSTFFGQGTPIDTTPPLAVSNLSGEAIYDGIKATWDASVDETALGGYVLQYKKHLDSKYLSRTLPAGVTTAYLRRLDSEATYDLKIFAYDKAGNLGPVSDAIQADSGIAIEFDGNPYLIPMVIVPPPTPISTEGGGGGGGGGCFLNALNR